MTGIRTPDVYRVDLAARQIIVEYIDNSKTVSERIYELTSSSDAEAEEKLTEIAAEMGKVIGKMHDSNIIHGDLTTSNILIQFDDNDKWDLCLIDFGLSYTKASEEDKAVDLYVLQRALTSKHDDVAWFFDKFLTSYRQFSPSCERILKKFNEVCSRGRKRTMIG